MTFDLTTRPWIPCEGLDGSIVELSTEDALTRAHELRGLAISSPLETIAVHRHLVAILHRAYQGPTHMSAWGDIYEAGCFDGLVVAGYLDSVRDRMDLFHTEHPFAQVRGLSERFGVDPIDMLTVQRRSWGTARELFQHRPPSLQPTMRPAEAARALLAYHAFDTGGLVKKPGEPTSASSAPLIGGAVVRLIGDTLFETLTLNLLRYDPVRAQPIPGSEDDAPAWEQPPPPRELKQKKEPRRAPKGWLDLLTWWSRRLELVHDGEQVTGFVRCVGTGLVDESPRDPTLAWQADPKRGWRPVAFRPDRAFWRDADALFLATETTTSDRERPAAIEQLCTEVALALVPPERMFTLEAAGLATSKSRVDLVRRELLRSTAPLLADADAGDAIQGAKSFASDSISRLNKALYVYAKLGLSPGSREPDAGDVRAQVQSFGANSAAWSELGVTFSSFLRTLTEDRLAARAAFEAACLESVRRLFEDVTQSGDQSARWLKARARAEQNLNIGLSQIPRVRLADQEVA